MLHLATSNVEEAIFSNFHFIQTEEKLTDSHLGRNQYSATNTSVSSIDVDYQQ